ncbi:ankyrin repeat domain-containing protein [Leptospira inadai]|nr:ankyrin repeat domain-containing protein [Leptospira inadai]PNV76359.1 hypothetical protein BES34_003690 [Leptospira inadai serovar Lyme]
MNRRFSEKFLPFLILLSTVFLTDCATRLASVIEKGNNEQAVKMLEAGANPNDSGTCNTPLHMAVKKGELALVQLLLKKGADPNLRSRECNYKDLFGQYKANNRSPLEAAKTLEIAKILFEAGADPRWGSYEVTDTITNWTPLYRAVLAERYDIAKYLVEKGANVNLYDDMNGKHILLRLLSERKDSRANILRGLLLAKGARELNFIGSLKKNISDSPTNSYRHIPTGNVTIMTPEMISYLKESPDQAVPITYSIADGRYYHYSEFEWTDTKQNLHEWLLLKRAEYEALKKKK